MSEPGWCDYIRPLAFPLPSIHRPTPLLSSAQYPWTVHFGLYNVGKIHLQNPLLLSWLVICCGSSNFMVQSEQGQQTSLFFFLVMH